MNQTLKQTLTIWFIKDQRAGHVNQLEGLANRLHAHQPINSHWLDIATLPFEWKHGLIKDPPRLEIPTPDVIISAGHQTHKPLLIAARLYQAVSVVLMKPSLPLNWFDIVICPAHDGLNNDSRTLNTVGALNKVNPDKRDELNDSRACLMLIGGPSKHYTWNNDTIIRQIREVCLADPDRHWQLSNSPRTPDIFIQTLLQERLANLEYQPFSPDKSEWLPDKLLSSEITWVTPDSISMIYEALTAQSKTALFDLPMAKKQKSGRVTRSIQQLIEQAYVTPFGQWQQSHRYLPAKNDLWEADRAARWLLEKLQVRPLS